MMVMPNKKIIHNKKYKLSGNIKKHYMYYLMVIPGCAFFLAFKYVPLLGSVIAFQDYSIYKGIFESPFVGLKHCAALFQHYDFKRVFANTIILGLCKTVLIFPIPVILSLMLNEVRNLRLKKAIQTAVYIPYFFSWVVVGGLVFDFLGLGGLFNHARALLGMSAILPMQTEAWFRPVYILSSIWKESGWGTVIYLAALSGIDISLYESAAMDGASMLDKIRFITFPLLIPTILTIFLLNIGGFLELGFDQVFNLLTPMTYSVGDIFDTYVYRMGIQGTQYSFTTAVGLFQSTVGFLLVVTFNYISKKLTDEGGLW
jgi:putative aldouronate transport system permease protein